MKQTYQTPSIKWLEAATEEMIAASTSIEQGFDLNSVAETTETSGNLSRQSLWDDDEE